MAVPTVRSFTWSAAMIKQARPAKPGLGRGRAERATTAELQDQSVLENGHPALLVKSQICNAHTKTPTDQTLLQWLPNYRLPR